MTGRALCLLLPLCLATSFAGCSSSEEQPASTTAAEKPAGVGVVAAPKKKKKKKKRARETGKKQETVKFTVKKASLKEVVLPLFAEQAGVRIAYTGTERKLSLRLSSPIHWLDALDLVCQFTDTHLTKDYRGNYVLKDGYAGTLGSSDEALAELDAEERAKAGSGGGSASRKRRYNKAPAAKGGGYRETVANTRTRTPGAGVVNYNGQRSPTQTIDKIGGHTGNGR